MTFQKDVAFGGGESCAAVAYKMLLPAGVKPDSQVVGLFNQVGGYGIETIAIAVALQVHKERGTFCAISEREDGELPSDFFKRMQMLAVEDLDGGFLGGLIRMTLHVDGGSEPIGHVVAVSDILPDERAVLVDTCFGGDAPFFIHPVPMGVLDGMVTRVDMGRASTVLSVAEIPKDNEYIRRPEIHDQYANQVDEWSQWMTIALVTQGVSG